MSALIRMKSTCVTALKLNEFSKVASKTLFRPDSVLRVQTDGSFSHKYSISRTAVLVANAKIDQYLVKTYFNHRNSYESEWQSVLDGIIYSIKKGKGSLELENDNLAVINSIIQRKRPDLAYARPYYSEIIDHSRYLDWLSIRWIPRKFNKADKLFYLN